LDVKLYLLSTEVTLDGGMSSNDLVVDLSVCEVANMCAVS